MRGVGAEERARDDGSRGAVLAEPGGGMQHATLLRPRCGPEGDAHQ